MTLAASIDLYEFGLYILGILAVVGGLVYRQFIKPTDSPAPKEPAPAPLSDRLAARERDRAETIRESDAKATAPADGPSVPGSDAGRVADLREWAESDD